MTTFQFDQCFNDKKLVASCNKEGKAVAYCYPKILLGKEDPEMLATLLPKGNPIVTTDRALPEEHCTHIPDNNPGMIVVCYSRRVVNKTITTSRAATILAQFKNEVTNWHTLSVHNTIIVITESDIEICRIQSGQLRSDTHIMFKDTPNWGSVFVSKLQKLTAPTTLPSPQEVKPVDPS